ncbi:hypothetical protein NLG97_g6969 [Lecanicillium saksenae]|uniref:Uncharacterized protein n=1 Tax=Lecanicillium saksenae TaxID=468837 RepID=A0ACC1QRX9_9HYPO|nr:hypothetical protein NLG97_g6969 [Lecanicillium saksenae]
MRGEPAAVSLLQGTATVRLTIADEGGIGEDTLLQEVPPARGNSHEMTPMDESCARSPSGFSKAVQIELTPQRKGPDSTRRKNGFQELAPEDEKNQRLNSVLVLKTDTGNDACVGEDDEWQRRTASSIPCRDGGGRLASSVLDCGLLEKGPGAVQRGVSG